MTNSWNQMLSWIQLIWLPFLFHPPISHLFTSKQSFHLWTFQKNLNVVDNLLPSPLHTDKKTSVLTLRMQHSDLCLNQSAFVTVLWVNINLQYCETSLFLPYFDYNQLPSHSYHQPLHSRPLLILSSHITLTVLASLHFIITISLPLCYSWKVGRPNFQVLWNRNDTATHFPSRSEKACGVYQTPKYLLQSTVKQASGCEDGAKYW